MDFNLDEILAACLKEDRRSQEKLYNYTYQKLINTPIRYTKSYEESKWVFNLAMLKVYRSLSNFKIGTNYLGWANNILIKTSIDYIRSNAKHKQIIAPIDSTIVQSENKTWNDALNKLETEEVVSIIQQLGENERLVFSMYEIDGYKHKEIEEITGIKLNTSKWLLAKAKKELRNIIASRHDINFLVNGNK